MELILKNIDQEEVQLLKRVVENIKRKDPSLWERIIDDAVGLVVDLEEFNGFSESERELAAFLVYLDDRLWTNEFVAEDAITVGTTIVELAQILSGIELDYSIIPDYESIHYEWTLEFYIVVAKKNGRIVRPPTALNWFCSVSNARRIFAYAAEIAKAAKEVGADG